jgi:hypothetical protein
VVVGWTLCHILRSHSQWLALHLPDSPRRIPLTAHGITKQCWCSTTHRLVSRVWCTWYTGVLRSIALYALQGGTQRDAIMQQRGMAHWCALYIHAQHRFVRAAGRHTAKSCATRWLQWQLCFLCWWRPQCWCFFCPRAHIVVVLHTACQYIQSGVLSRNLLGVLFRLGVALGHKSVHGWWVVLPAAAPLGVRRAWYVDSLWFALAACTQAVSLLVVLSCCIAFWVGLTLLHATA